MATFIFGGDTNETPDSIRRKRQIAQALLAAQGAPRNIGEGLNALGDGIVSAVLNSRADKAEKAGQESIANDFAPLLGGFGASPSAPGATGSSMPKVDASGNVPPVKLSDGEVYDGFMGEVKKGITNPYGLAAVAATGNAESGFSPGNVNRTWSDPSESGQSGRAGGIMSWRGPRYDALAATGDLSPAGQAKFFLQEDPNLITALNNAKSVEEAQNLMNRAWAFKGYDRPGGEAARRLAAAQSYLPKFQQTGGGAEVASLDPAAGMPDTASAYVDPAVTTDYRAPQAADVAAPGNIPVPTPRPSQAVAQALMAPQKGGRVGGPQPLTDGDFNSRFGNDATGAVSPPGAALRPFKPGETRPNPDGSYSTEISTTWQTPDGKWVNVPSLWMGPNGPQQFNPNDEDGILGAMGTYEAANGPTFQRYGSEQEAVAAAKARSAAGGAGSGPQLGNGPTSPQSASQSALPPLPVSTIAPAPNVASVPPVADTGQRPSQPNQQVAQALMQPQQQSDAGNGYFPAAPNPPGQSGPSQQQILRVLTNPFASEGQKAVAQALLQRNLDANDPDTQLDREYKRAQIAALTGKSQEPEAVRSLKLRAQEAGLQPGTPEYQQFMTTGGRGPLVSVNTGNNSSKFTEESDKAAAGRLNDYVQGGNSASQLLGDIQTLADLGTQIETGLGAQAMASLGPYAEALGVNIEGLGPAQAYQSIVNKMAPQMRPAGSGSSSDTDVRMFLSSLPSLRNDPTANAIIIDTFKGIQDNKIAAADIASKAYIPKEEGGISWQEAEKQIRALPNPYERFKAYQKDRQKQAPVKAAPAPVAPGAPTTPKPAAIAPPVGTVEDGYRFKGGDPTNPENWEQAL